MCMRWNDNAPHPYKKSNEFAKSRASRNSVIQSLASTEPSQVPPCSHHSLALSRDVDKLLQRKDYACVPQHSLPTLSSLAHSTIIKLNYSVTPTATLSYI